jgi:hypothetical protein
MEQPWNPPRIASRRVIRRAPEIDQHLQGDGYSQDGQDVESHLVTLGRIRSFRIELFVFKAIYSHVLCGVV